MSGVVTLSSLLSPFLLPHARTISKDPADSLMYFATPLTAKYSKHRYSSLPLPLSLAFSQSKALSIQEMSSGVSSYVLAGWLGLNE